MDLGECTKIHDLALRADYEIASKERDLFFELDVRFVFLFDLSVLQSISCYWEWCDVCKLQSKILCTS